jgi:hypothetical protein
MSKANDPDAEVTGEYLIPFVEAAGKVSPVFERKLNDEFKKQVGELREDGWYRVGDVSTAYENVRSDVGAKTMEEGGKEVSKALPFSDDVPLEKRFEILQDETKNAYRNTDHELPAGGYTWEFSGDRSARLGTTEGFIYTSPFVKGLFTGIIKQSEEGATNVRFDVTDAERGEQSVWMVEW